MADETMTAANPNWPYPGIHRLRLPLTGSPLKYVNSYLLPGRDGHLLIDTGWNTADTFGAFMQQLAAAGLQPADIKRLVITHAHIDHYGMAARLLQHADAHLIMHALEAQMIALRYRNPRQYTGQSNTLLREAGAAEDLLADTRQVADRFARLTGTVEPHTMLHGGERLRHARFAFEVIWTPGHSPGHICLYEPAHKLLFSGDHVLPGITPNVGRYPQSGANPLEDYLASLKRIRSLDVRLVLPAHGPPMTGFTRRVDQILAHHEKRKDEILRIIAEQTAPITAYALVQAMRWYAKRRPIAWQSLRIFDQRLAVSEVSAHLASLAAEGRLVKRNTAGADYYQLPAKAFATTGR